MARNEWLNAERRAFGVTAYVGIVLVYGLSKP